MGVFFLYGPIGARGADRNGYRYLLGPVACTLAGLAVHLAFPYDPYRSNRRSERSLYRLDERDEDARRLVEILRSPEHLRVTLLAAARFAALVFVAMAGFTIVFRSSLNWDLPSSWLYQGLGGGALFAWMFIKVQTIGWALVTSWEEPAEPGKQ